MGTTVCALPVVCFAARSPRALRVRLRVKRGRRDLANIIGDSTPPATVGRIYLCMRCEQCEDHGHRRSVGGHQLVARGRKHSTERGQAQSCASVFKVHGSGANQPLGARLEVVRSSCRLWAVAGSAPVVSPRLNPVHRRSDADELAVSGVRAADDEIFILHAAARTVTTFAGPAAVDVPGLYKLIRNDSLPQVIRNLPSFSSPRKGLARLASLRPSLTRSSFSSIHPKLPHTTIMLTLSRLAILASLLGAVYTLPLARVRPVPACTYR
jgi:hypothetical protein